MAARADVQFHRIGRAWIGLDARIEHVTDLAVGDVGHVGFAYGQIPDHLEVMLFTRLPGFCNVRFLLG